MSMLLHGDCLEHMKHLDAESVDLIFCDLPYGQTGCQWDCKIDHEKFWDQIMRIKKTNTPIFMTTTTKFGIELIQSAPKKCPFRYDLVWVKSAPCGFLSAKKMPMRKHEMVYVFYEKLPYYDLSSHKHKFQKKATASQNGPTYGGGGKEPDAEVIKTTYDPPLPVSVVKYDQTYETDLYGGVKRDDRKNKIVYDPPLPVSIIKDTKHGTNTYDTEKRKKPITREPPNKYDPPLPVSVVKEPTTYGKNSKKNYNKEYAKEGVYNKNQVLYDPPLPVSVVKEDKHTLYGDIEEKGIPHTTTYDPPLPTTMLEIKSTRGKHSTEKPVALMEWILKYYSKEGDVVLDPTMGSGSTGVACKNMNRNFIGIEMDPEIFEVAMGRIES